MSKQKKLYEAAGVNFQYPFRVNVLMWDDMTLFYGPLSYLSPHALGALAINVALYQPFLFRTGGNSFMSTQCIMIEPAVKHEMVGGHDVIVASLILEQSEYSFIDRASLQHRLNNDMWVSVFRTIYEEKPAKVDARERIVKLLNSEGIRSATVDDRLKTAIQAVRRHNDGRVLQSAFAEFEGLSASRFRHLFKEQLTVSYRHYGVWQRVLSGLRCFHQVDNLTHAAMEAGFTDSSHLNRCFKMTLGATPSQIFKSMDRFEVE